MQLYTLGTSHGNHTPGRFATSSLLVGEKYGYMIDAGEPASAQVFRLGIPYETIRAVFITHMHDDHTSGLTALTKAILKYPNEDVHTDIYFPDESAIVPFRNWQAAVHITDPAHVLTYHTATAEGIVYENEEIKVRAIPTLHMDGGAYPSFAYLIETADKRILFTGDLTPDLRDFPKVEGHIDVCVCEATHYKPVLALPLFEKMDFGKLIFNHLHELYIGNGEDAFLENYKSLPYPVFVSHDLEAFRL